MSALPKPDVSRRSRFTSADVRASHPLSNSWLAGDQPRRLRSVPSAPTVVPDPRSRVRRLPPPQPAPLWLKLLLGLQQSSTLATWGLVTGVLALYGWTVYSQQAWNQSFRKLETLQRNEQQLVAASEVWKDYVAELATVPGSGLVPAKPTNTILVEPAPQRPMPSAETPETAAAIVLPDLPKPLGY